MKNVLLSTSLIGFIEVTLNHPLEYIKTQYQNGVELKRIKFDKSLYVNSLIPRYSTIIPMRTVFWSSLHYNEKYKNDIITTTLITSKLQTLIDFPSEQIKTKQIMYKNISIRDCFNCNYVYHGYIHNLLRNGIFLYFYLYFTQKEKNNLNVIYGSFSGILMSQPFDGLKTIYQTGNKDIIKKSINSSLFYKGLTFRLSITTLSMILGNSILMFLDI